eukprot:scaffold640374_cov16-Prasinocladus_malaysianus.AAC.1
MTIQLAGRFVLAWCHHIVVVHAAIGRMKVLYFTFLISNASVFKADSSQVKGIAPDVDKVTVNVIVHDPKTLSCIAFTCTCKAKVAIPTYCRQSGKVMRRRP